MCILVIKLLTGEPDEQVKLRTKPEGSEYLTRGEMMKTDELARLRASHAELLAALLPFSAEQFSTPYGGNVQGDESPVYARPPAILTIGDFRRARAALANAAAIESAQEKK